MTVKTTTNKLLELYQAIEPIKKDSVNPHFKNRYFDINSLLSVIKPIAEQVGVMILQPIDVDNGDNILTTQIIDNDTGVVMISSRVKLPDNTDPQKIGSAITYYRRYSLQALLCLEAEDDDGNLASGAQQPLKRNFEPSRGVLESKPLSYKVCPFCNKEHQGQYPKCMECYQKEKSTGIKLEKPKVSPVDYNQPPF